ncbi:hypothetical protein NQ314_004418 [Rhamnusium bicolor]|uniref:Uncharacterized protein n=1 Tax=Rhamnusium bicolor TaxID=1586634 RepID=A0AAV8ZLM1_9CUCU|nr:hypothetical protein NQ314_004418 [Rhamnusium bicolor]
MIICAADSGIPWTSLQGCLSSGQADELLVENGERTYSVEPKITGIPTIIFNDIFSDALNRMARTNFLNVVEFISEGRGMWRLSFKWVK